MSKPIPKVRQDSIYPVDIYSRTGEKSLDEKVLQPYRHIAQHLKRKPITLITNAYNYWFNVPKEKLAAIEEIFRIIYNASILFDDVEDRSTLRRGIPVAHSIYGASSTLVAANYAYSIALDKILDFIEAEVLSWREVALQHLEDIEETNRTVGEIFAAAFRGQGQEIYWKENFICPTEEEYCHMCAIKSNGLLNLITTLMASCSTRKDDFSKFNYVLAECLQMVNDYKNFTSKDCFKSKTFCDDITEGKFSLAVIHAIRSRPEDHQIIDILRLGTTDPKLKQHFISLLWKFGSLEYTRKKIEEVREKVVQEAKGFGKNPPMDILIRFAFGEKK